MGDPAGIGPEVTLKAISNSAAKKAGPYLLVGSSQVFERTARQLGLNFSAKVISKPDEISGTESDTLLLQTSLDSPEIPDLNGKLTPQGALASALAVEEATQLCLSGTVEAMVTAPLTKQGLALAGRDFPGHTEMLAALAGTPGEELMLLVGGGLRVALVTTHVAIADLPQLITTPKVLQRLRTLDAGLRKDFGLNSPRIAVLALNPHAGEGGRFGNEEQQQISPAIEQARNSGIDASGPHPADTAFFKAINGEYDAVLATYHDQGLAVLKTLAFDTGVNVTMGLPLVRTSPDHGTAYDIAGSGKASERSMLEAILLARLIASRRG